MHTFLNDLRVIKILDEFGHNLLNSNNNTYNNNNNKENLNGNSTFSGNSDDYNSNNNIKRFSKIEERFSFTKKKATVNLSLNLLKLKNEKETSDDVKQILKNEEETLAPELKKSEEIFKEQLDEQQKQFKQNLKIKIAEKVKFLIILFPIRKKVQKSSKELV